MAASTSATPTRAASAAGTWPRSTGCTASRRPAWIRTRRPGPRPPRSWPRGCASSRTTMPAQPWASLWDDGADATAELTRLMGVRRQAIDHFGLAELAPGEPMSNLQRRFVPIWLLHRYQTVAAAKAIGGVEMTYAVNGGGREVSAAVAPQAQRAALAA